VHRSSTPARDDVGPAAGEEFLLLLSATDARAARRQAERLRAA
jgi:PleD family two-component response regulator